MVRQATFYYGVYIINLSMDRSTVQNGYTVYRIRKYVCDQESSSINFFVIVNIIRKAYYGEVLHLSYIHWDV